MYICNINYELCEVRSHDPAPLLLVWNVLWREKVKMKLVHLNPSRWLFNEFIKILMKYFDITSSNEHTRGNLLAGGHTDRAWTAALLFFHAPSSGSILRIF